MWIKQFNYKIILINIPVYFCFKLIADKIHFTNHNILGAHTDTPDVNLKKGFGTYVNYIT